MDLISVYNEILWDYRNEIENFEVQGYLNKADRLMESADEFPEELKNILFTMKDHSIQLVENRNTGEIRANYFMSDMYRDAQWNFHPNTYGYTLLATGPLVVNGMLSYSAQESFSYILVMEETLEKVTKDEVLYPALEAEYLSFFHQMIKGSPSEDVFDERGFVKDEYRDAWQRLSNIFGARPAKYLLMPIVEEMEASGWQKSKSWEAFNKEKIEETLVLARTGELERVMYGEPPVVEDDSITLPNEEFSSQVEQLYNEFKQSYDIHVFKGVSPLFTVGVFDYANEVEDPATMYHLLRNDFDEYWETGITQSLDEYVESWKKGFSIFRDANRIDFFTANMQRMRYDFYASVDVQSNSWGRSIGIYLDDKENWFIQDVVHEALPSSQNESGVAIDATFRSEVRDLYQSFSESESFYMLEGREVSRVIGLYLYAGELRDYETQYALLWKGEEP